MLAMKCPPCGAPIPLSLAAPGIARCAFCGYEGAPSPDVRARLDGAAQALSGQSARERQIRGAVSLAVAYGQAFEMIYGIFSLLLLGGMALVILHSAYRFSITRGVAAATGAAMGLSVLPSFLLVAGAGLASVTLLRRARRRVERAAAAEPPAREGEPMRCHVCGGPLAVAGVKAIARCAYCGSDNVVSALAIARAGAERRAVLDDYAGEVKRQSGGVGRAFRLSTLLLGSTIAATPFACVIPTWILTFSVWTAAMVGYITARGTGPPTPGNRYALVDADGDGQCIAWYNLYEGKWQRRGRSVEHPDVDVPAGRIEEIALADILGTRVRIDNADLEDGFAGTARRPRWGSYTKRDGALADGPDWVTLSDPKATRSVTAPLWACCLAEGAADHSAPEARSTAPPGAR
ncbi:MAG: hypothetical protein U0166_19390 [Acidobacteriota bacterium]